MSSPLILVTVEIPDNKPWFCAMPTKASQKLSGRSLDLAVREALKKASLSARTSAA